MNVKVNSVDYAPNDLYAQTPFVAHTLRQIPGPDRPDYWLAEDSQPGRVRKSAKVSPNWLLV